MVFLVLSFTAACPRCGKVPSRVFLRHAITFVNFRGVADTSREEGGTIMAGGGENRPKLP